MNHIGLLSLLRVLNTLLFFGRRDLERMRKIYKDGITLGAISMIFGKQKGQKLRKDWKQLGYTTESSLKKKGKTFIHLTPKAYGELHVFLTVQRDLLAECLAAMPAPPQPKA